VSKNHSFDVLCTIHSIEHSVTKNIVVYERELSSFIFLLTQSNFTMSNTRTTKQLKQSGTPPSKDTAVLPDTPSSHVPATPVSMATGNWSDNKEALMYFAPNGHKREIKSFIKSGNKIDSHLFTNVGVDFLGRKFLLQVWGDRPSELFDNYFTSIALKETGNVYVMQNTDVIKDDDDENLILVAQEPNQYEQQYRKVYKLQTKKKTKFSKSKFNLLAFYP
jgi:hypothetical protein